MTTDLLPYVPAPGMRVMTCVNCEKQWEREAQSGRPPMFCSETCRKAVRAKDARDRRKGYQKSRNKIVHQRRKELRELKKTQETTQPRQVTTREGWDTMPVALERFVPHPREGEFRSLDVDLPDAEIVVDLTMVGVVVKHAPDIAEKSPAYGLLKKVTDYRAAIEVAYWGMRTGHLEDAHAALAAVR